MRWVPSLRTRLVAVAVALVAFASLATGVATYFALKSYLYGKLDDELLRQARAIANSPGVLCDDKRPGVRLIAQDGYVKAIADDGTVLEQCSVGRTYESFEPSSAATATLIADDGEPHSVGATSGTIVRAVSLPQSFTVETDDGFDSVKGTLIVAISEGDIGGTLGKLLWLEGLAAGIAVVGTAVLGAAGVRIGLRPLDRVTRTARTVSAELGPDGTGLDRRVVVDSPNTEVGQLGVAVNTMLDAVEREYTERYESEQRMRRFLADASHELRTPLTSLRGYAELIRMRGGDGFDADANDSLRRIESEGTRMARLVDDLLTLARHDRGQVPTWELVDLGEIVDDAAAGLHAAHPDREVTVRSVGRTTVLGDRDQLHQVLNNVLANAAKHTREGGPITVSLDGPTDQRQTAVHIAVADAGPGLRPDQVQHVFERFWRADSGRLRSRGGSGLGLSIVHALVTGHGGTVGFRSDPDAGSTVEITLPAVDPNAVPSAPRDDRADQPGAWNGRPPVGPPRPVGPPPAPVPPVRAPAGP